MDASIRRKILDLLDAHRVMTLATLRPDGWPQATTVGYVNEGLVLYFCACCPASIQCPGNRCRSRCPPPTRSASSASTRW